MHEPGVARDDTKGTDIRQTVDIDFIDAILGKQIEVEINKRIRCHGCRGTRAK